MTRKSAMEPSELETIITDTHGSRGQRKMAADMRKSEVTISRWLARTTPISETDAALLRLICILDQRGLNWRKLLAEYEAAAPEPVKRLEDYF